MTHIRRAVPTDAEGVAKVHVASWQAAYQDILPADFLDGLRWERRFEFWSEALMAPDTDDHRTWVSTVGGEVVGFAATGPARDEDRSAAGTYEFYGIYLLPDQWSLGVGRTLAQTALSELPEATVDVSLWVLAQNQRARRFYERLGFVTDGQQRVETFGGREVSEVRYLRRRDHPLSPPSVTLAAEFGSVEFGGL